MMSGRTIYAQLHLLDRQVIEQRHGHMVAKVDDVEIDLDHPVPHVTALLTGPAALGPRLPGLLGRFVLSVHRRLHPAPDPQPNPIPAGRIVDITSAVLVDTDDELDVQGFGRWVDDQIIRRIPGSGHASE
jgi:sporulation protein YlmC with PRC-barrel domain